MVKISKEYSDAFGFRLLGHFTSFLTQHPKVASEIQKICDDDFRETCLKCYPKILATGVDPATYVPPVTQSNAPSVRSILLQHYPTKTLVEKDDESTGSCSEEDEAECVVVATNIIGPSKPKLSPVIAQKVEAGLKCTKCLTLTNDLTSVRKNMGETIKNLELENEKLRSQVHAMKNAGLGVADKLTQVRKELEAEKTISHNRLLKWNKLVTDPEYVAWQDYRNFESFKRKRTQ